MPNPSPSDTVGLEVARLLLQIGAISLSPRELYTWASGVRAPIYCDNRRLLGFPVERQKVLDAWAQHILTSYPDVQALAGVATAGIPHAALLAERLRVPMVYVRPEPKDHGLGKTVEGFLPPGSRTVVVEDMISTAGSLTRVVRHLKAARAPVLAATAIVTYGLPQAEARMAAEHLPWSTLAHLDHVKRAAREMGTLTEAELALVDRAMIDVDAQLRAKDSALAAPSGTA